MDRSRGANDRRQHVSNRYKKSQKKLRALQKRINNKRKDAIHKFTHEVTNNHGTVVIESLDVQKMIKKLPGRGARRAASRACMGEVLRQLAYKAQHHEKAPWYYASSQLCSSCGHRHPMPLNQRTYVCPHCGLELDRDLNAARSLANYISQPGQG
jgi:putative transposase